MLDKEGADLRPFYLTMEKVIFVCIHNAGRSQMAEAFFNKISQGRALAISAGTQPAARINPTVVAAMHEVGIEIGDQKPKPLTSEMLEDSDRVITMGCNVAEACPTSTVPTEDWGIDDPEGKPIEQVRHIRDTIKGRVEELVEEIL
jgi:arsenate reductase